MEQLLNLLKQQPKEILQWIILELMEAGKLSFADITMAHVEHLEELRKGNTKELMALRGKIVNMWCGTKRDLPSKLVSLIQEGKDNGWVNIAQEKIDNSKWQINKL